MDNQLWAALKPLTERKDGTVDIDVFLSILMPCIKEQILYPRHELLATLDILFDIMISSGEDEIKIKNVRDNIIKWLMRWDIKFLDIDNPIPNEVNEIVMKVFSKTVSQLLGQYAKELPENFNEERTLRTEKLTIEWVSPKQMETIIVEKPVQKKEFNPDDWKTGWTKGHRSGKEFKNMSKQILEELIEQGLADKSMLEIWEKIDRQGFKSLSESVKTDNETFETLFQKFNVPPLLQLEAKSLWYGSDPYQTPMDHNSFLGYAVSRNKPIPKVRGKDIPPDISRAILQCYIVGLIQGANLKQIYQTFIHYVESYVGSYGSKIIHIYDSKTNLPNKTVDEILEEFFNNVKINPQINYIRKNWGILRKPNIDIRKLCELIDEFGKKSNGNKKKAWEMKLYANQLLAGKIKNVSKKLTIDEFATKFYNKYSRPKVILKQGQIKDSLTYQIDPTNPGGCT